MKEYKNPNEIKVSQLIEILKECDSDAIVINGKDENIKIYPGMRIKDKKQVVKIC